MRKVLVVTVAVALLAGGGTALATMKGGGKAAASSSSAACGAGALSGAFTHIPGSEGAGNVSYQLTLLNSSSSACFVAGIGKLVLLDKQGKALPTSAEFAKSSKLELAAGAGVASEARFSPDVPGTGEPTNGPCEKTAYWLTFSPVAGGGTVKVAITPPTMVCVKGHMSFRAFKPAKGGNYSSCIKNAQTTLAMQACITAEYKRVDALLNATYKKLIGTSGVDKAKLISAEKAWITFRDADCKFAGSLNAGGSLASINVGTCLIDDTVARAKELQIYLKQLKP
jgi:uncharacterized protein YecT (DUF1311 family)